MDSQRILLTGGAGFIGTNLVNELRRGHEVLAVDLFNTRAQRRRGEEPQEDPGQREEDARGWEELGEPVR